MKPKSPLTSGATSSGNARGAGCRGASAPSASASESGVPGGGSGCAGSGCAGKGNGGSSGSFAGPQRQSALQWATSPTGEAKGPGASNSGVACTGDVIGEALHSAKALMTVEFTSSFPNAGTTNERRAERFSMPCLNASFSACNATCRSWHLASSSRSPAVASSCRSWRWFIACRARAQSSCTLAATLASASASVASRKALMASCPSWSLQSSPRMSSSLDPDVVRTLSVASGS
mmetsp:Transcript_117124/g.364719  ORF Transcript_117124/g.364719 Transcript_117124/m.364719 type:complete len:234 (-) Transcript_117124:171-872(-)